MSIKFRLSILLFFMTAGLSAQEKTSLEFGYQQGSVYRYRTADTFNSQQEIGSQEMKIGGGSRSLIRMEVALVDTSRSLTCITSLEEMKTMVRSPLMDTLIDQPELIGKREKVVVNRNGYEVSRERIDSVGQSGNKGFMAINFARNVPFFQLPGRPLNPGEKWKANIRDSTASGEGYLMQSGSIEFTLAGREKKNNHDCMKIDFTSRIDHTGKMKEMGMNVFIEGTGDTRGSIWFDVAAGILIQRESTAVQDLIFAITGPATMTVPMTQEVKSVYTLVE